MMSGAGTTLAGILSAIIVGIVGLLLTRKDKRKQDEKKIETAPDAAADDLADIDERERLQNSGSAETSAES
jgi:hypothetical protein